MRTQNYNPDVLTCLANLSNDEVFTPPAVVNKMLDMLPAELWSNPDAKFLDPVSKTGVFLREIAKRLMDGLAEQIPDVQERADHIFGKQLYGLAITELTALMSRRSVYCSKFANGRYSVCTAFDDEQGNIRYEPTAHTWINGRCFYCGASKEVYDRGDSLESHAYKFIHTDNPKKLFPKMKFDVIIGNPPYQLSDGGAQASATPIYQLFVTQAQKLKPRFLTMIIPARWYGGGKGLDTFREDMISDKRIRILHDFLNANECFGNGVEIKGGVCYFLWDRDNEGMCQVYTHQSDSLISQEPRFLKEGESGVFIRYQEGVSVYNKVKQLKEKSFSTLVSTQKPFGLRTFAKGKTQPFPKCIKLYQNGGVGYITPEEVERNLEMVSKYKIYVSRAYNAGDNYPHQIIGKPILGEPNSCCSETYVSIGPFKDKKETQNVISYINTKFFRFMVFLIKVSQMASSKVYEFVPIQDFTQEWTDEKLYTKYGLTNDEIAFIESMIRPME